MNALKKSYAGYSMTPLEWAQSLGIKKRTLDKRFREMGIEKAITYQLKKRIAECKKKEEEAERIKFLEEMQREKQRIEDERWANVVDGGIESVQLMMLARGYFRKENRIRAYKMLNTWYKEFRSENMKAA